MFARGGTWTLTPRALDPKSSVSANFTTLACFSQEVALWPNFANDNLSYLKQKILSSAYCKLVIIFFWAMKGSNLRPTD